MGWFGSHKRHDAEREFSELVLVHWDTLYRFALRLSGDDATAQDLVQEAITKALKHFHRVRPDTNYRAWLFTVVRNAFVSRLRKAGRLALVEDVDLLPVEAEPELPVGRALEALGHDRFKDGFEDEVFRALATLPEVQRSAVILCDIEELDYEAIAHILGCPVGTVRSRIHHGRKRLKEALASYAQRKGYGHVQSQ